jgi:SNF2 family DNA or RNA helicase
MANDGPWVLDEPIKSLIVVANRDGIRLQARPAVLSDPLQLGSSRPKNRLGKLLPTLIPQLVELNVAEYDDGGLNISYPNFVELHESEIDAFDDLVPWSPFSLEITSSGTLGRENFAYSYRFYLGHQPVYPVRMGCFLRRGERIYRLDRQGWALIEAIESFNALPRELKASADAFVRFAEIRGLGEGVGAQLDGFIASQKILVPARIALDFVVEDDGRISFVPKIAGVPSDEMTKVFLRSEDVDEVFTLDDSAGGRVRVVFNNEQREALRRMQQRRHLGGAERADALRNPNSVFDGVANAVDIDFASYGPRVKGIGDFPFVVQPFIRRSPLGIFEGPDELAERPSRTKFEAGLICDYADGTTENVEFHSREEILNLHIAAHEAIETGKGLVELNGKSISVDSRFLGALDELTERICRTPKDKREPKPRQFLLIYTNEEQIDYSLTPDQMAAIGARRLPEIPHAVRGSASLKEHQRAGIAWLQRSYFHKRGCLLADDMGLGKTLQTLVFLAWLIEHEQKWAALPPWKPILIVAPLILVDDDGPWLKDMRTYFEGDGAIFRPVLSMHGESLKQLRKEPGKEVELGKPILNLDQIQQNRVVLTNYETVTNYQHSFAAMKDGWSVVVADESQEYKAPNTKVSHAMKSLAPGFRLGLTGTPVETRLSDVWNIFDFLQPGELLGSLKQFSETYGEGSKQSTTIGDVATGVVHLKQRLRFGTANAYLLRREKATLGDGLPVKHEVLIDCELSTAQRERYLELIQAARSAEGESRIKWIWQIMRLHQHPVLVPRYEPVSTQTAIDNSPKLAAVLEKLADIRRRNEKVLIFTRHLDMQQLLSQVIGEKFKLSVDIVNGSTSRTPVRGKNAATRNEIIKRFCNSPGYNVLVLSPDVAGLGLNLVDANHVVHYGRWWNPAKEAQATDRVYRIGQTRQVFVYHPIARDPKGQFRTFDEKLNEILERRRSLATEFLTPMSTEAELESELFEQLASGAGRPTEARSGIHKPVSEEQVRLLPPDRFEALAAALFEKEGHRVVLTPFAVDEGIDVIAAQQGELRLIQCKHTLWRGTVDIDAVDDLVGAFDGYRGRRLIPRNSRNAVIPVLFTNGSLSRAARNRAMEKGVEIIQAGEIASLAARLSCSFGDIESSEHRRLQSMADVQAALRNLAQAQ